MRNLFALILNMFCTLGYSQLPRLQSIIQLTGNDTVEIQRFDEKQRLVFHKITPPFGTQMVLTYAYDGDRLTNYTWSHSERGFIVSDYTYDNASGQRTTWSYGSKQPTIAETVNTFRLIE